MTQKLQKGKIWRRRQDERDPIQLIYLNFIILRTSSKECKFTRSWITHYSLSYWSSLFIIQTD